MGFWGLFILLSHLAFGAEPLSPWYLAQPVPPRGPWFDGWYTRYQDRKSGLSFAVIATADRLGSGRIEGALSGRLTLLIQEPGSARLQVREFSSEIATVKNEIDNFTWSSPEFGYVSHQGTDLSAGSSIQVETRMLDFVPAYRDENLSWGPMGWAQFVRLLPVHWYVATTRSEAKYKLVWMGRVFEGIAEVHTEKNWGHSFPEAWVWSQGFSESGEAQFAVSGGLVNLGPIQKKHFLWVYRSKKLAFEISPAQPAARFVDEIDSCRSRLKLRASNSRYRVELHVEAHPGTYGRVSVPTAQGYLPESAAESFLAQAAVAVYESQPQGGAGQLIERSVFSLAALEFGMDFLHCLR